MASDTMTMNKPAIVLTRSDHERLAGLAEAASARDVAVAEQLAAELDRAGVADEGEVAPQVVRMGSRVRFCDDSGGERQVTLVYPGEADIAQGRVSILTPIGVALIGLSVGQSIDWLARDGRSRRLEVLEVAAPH